jgi:hypothetical protein
MGPAILTWDGAVSAFAAYTVDELRDLTRGFGDGSYDWEDRFPIPTPIGAVHWPAAHLRAANAFLTPKQFLIGCKVHCVAASSADGSAGRRA